MANFYANPYDTSASGFYFDDNDEMERKYAASRAEEFEIDLMDGSPAEVSLWQMIGPLGMPDMETWFDRLEDLDEHEMAALGFLVGDLNVPLETALETYDEPIMRTGSAEDAVAEFVDDIGGPGNITNPEYYFDFASFGRDLRMDDHPFHGDSYEDMGLTDEEGDKLREQYERMSDEELAEDHLDGMGGVKELGKQTLENYFDYAKLARDMGYNSELAEFRFAGTNYVVMNAAGLG
jgi:antirestriction protein